MRSGASTSTSWPRPPRGSSVLPRATGRKLFTSWPSVRTAEVQRPNPSLLLDTAQLAIRERIEEAVANRWHLEQARRELEASKQEKDELDGGTRDGSTTGRARRARALRGAGKPAGTRGCATCRRSTVEGPRGRVRAHPGAGCRTETERKRNDDRWQQLQRSAAAGLVRRLQAAKVRLAPPETATGAAVRRGRPRSAPGRESGAARMRWPGSRGRAGSENGLVSRPTGPFRNGWSRSAGQSSGCRAGASTWTTRSTRSSSSWMAGASRSASSASSVRTSTGPTLTPTGTPTLGASSVGSMVLCRCEVRCRAR